jgi:purine-binding chemotaxis protein CheW
MGTRNQMPKRNSKQEEEPCLLFSLGEETYGVRIKTLREIVNPAGMEPVSPAFPYTEVLQFRGNKIPVLRLSDFFEYPNRQETARSVLVIGTEEKPFGLLVDEVKGVSNVPTAGLKPLSRLATRLDPRYIRGIGKLEGRIVFFLGEDSFSQIEEISTFYSLSDA